MLRDRLLGSVEWNNSPDGQILAGSTDKSLYVWDLAQLRTHLQGLSLDF